eukprot:m.78781 g.78781  ORF g.78781 m.78781 type:complete len:55 (+) comp9245_c0_seq1:131-295(+)
MRPSELDQPDIQICDHYLSRCVDSLRHINKTASRLCAEKHTAFITNFATHSKVF